MKVKRSTLIPALLLVYLAITSVFGWEKYSSGAMTATEYFGIIALTLAVIAGLHFNLRRRERLRAERNNDLTNNSKK